MTTIRFTFAGDTLFKVSVTAACCVKGSPWSNFAWIFLQWFEKEMPGKDPQATLDDLDGDGWNGWHGRPYIYDEYYHATAWVGREAVSFIQNFNSTPAGKAGQPYFLKVQSCCFRRHGFQRAFTLSSQQHCWWLQISFHRPHSPYDPPERLLKQTLQRKLPDIVVSTDGWDDMFRGGPTDPPGCGPSNNDAWCGLMPANESALSRAAYFASVQFVDEQVWRADSCMRS